MGTNPKTTNAMSELLNAIIAIIFFIVGLWLGWYSFKKLSHYDEKNLEIFQNKCIVEVDRSLNYKGRFDGQVDHDWSENGTDYGFTLSWKFNKLTGNFDELELIYYVDFSEKPYDFSEFDKLKIMDIECKE